MSQSQASSASQAKRKKILRTRVKVWGRFNLRSQEVFNVDKAEQLIHKAVDAKTSVQTVMKLYSNGLRIGDKGVLAALSAEFISYDSITAFISLRETPTLLALCSKTDQNSLVTVVQFKDVSALEVVCDIIDRQRAVMTGGRGTATPSQPASSLSRSEVSAVQQQPKPSQQTLPAVVVTTAPKEEPKVTVTVPTVTISEAVATTLSEPTVVSSNEATSITTTNMTRVEDVSVVVSSSSSGGASNVLFEKRPFVAEITQPPASAEVTAVVHAPPQPPSTTAATILEEDDDDNHFRTSIVFGEEIRVSEAQPVVNVAAESAERQKRMETVLLQRANGHAVSDSGSKRTSVTPIDTVILNYDDLDIEGTHAVFDTPDGPPTQLNESAENLRFPRPQSLQVTASTSSKTSSLNAQRAGGSRYVVTSFSSGRSDSPTDSQAIYVRTSPTGSAEQAYRTSTVIYRDSVDGAVERPRVSYVTNSPTGQRGFVGAPASPQLQQVAYQQQQQPMQLVRLVPVGGARRRVVHTHQQPAQLYTIQPVARENGVHLGAK